MTSSVKMFVGILAVFLLGVISGVFASSFFAKPVSTAKDIGQMTSSSYQAGFDAARKLVETSSLGKSIKTQENSRNLSGAVTKVGEGMLTVHVTNSLDPFADPALANRTVILNASTTLTLISEKSPAEKTQGEETTVSIPTFERTSIQASDIRVGDNVGVFLSAETVASKEPTALAVQVLPRK